MDQRRVAPSEREEKQVRRLQRRKNRQAEGRFLAEGVRVVEDLLASPLTTEWVLAASSLEDSQRGADLLEEVQRRVLPLRVLPEERFLKLAPTEHSQGVLAIARVPTFGWADISVAEPSSVVLLLDAIQDPGNLGTLVRTAEALGVEAIVTLPGTVDPWNPKSVRSAAGSLFRVPIVAASWQAAAEQLRSRGYRLQGADMAGAPPRSGGGGVGLVMGNEGTGLSPEVREGLDGTIGIPLRGRAESLNVAAAAAILLYELTR